MFKRSCFFLLLIFAFATSTTTATADEVFRHPNTDWLTWTLQDAAGDNISLAGYQNQSLYVVVFSTNSDDACTMMRSLAEHIRDHPNQAGKVLALCSNDTGAKALKLHVRQEEYAKRVAGWEAEQTAARAAAEQANEQWSPEPMPDFVGEIEAELADPEDLADLMAYHFPFNAASRCEAMWDWLCERMESPAKAPRILKFNSNGVETHEWSAPFDVPQLLGN
jgi:hypothetical protein